MASVASQLIQEVTAHAQSDSLEDVREICADGTYFLNNLRIKVFSKYFFPHFFLVGQFYKVYITMMKLLINSFIVVYIFFSQKNKYSFMFLKCNYIFHFCPTEWSTKFNYILTAASGKILNMCKYNRY